MNFSFPPLMNSPQIMSTHPLQPSPFAPDQFLTRRSVSPTLASPFRHHTESSGDLSDEEMSSPHGFIKKRPLEVTEDLVAGRLETVPQRVRRRRSTRALSRGSSEPPCLGFPLAMEGVEPMTPPNRPLSPISLAPRDMTLFREAERLRHSSHSRRQSSSRRSAKVRRSCTGIPISKKALGRESSPILTSSRSPLGRWTPPTVSAFQLFSTDSPDLPTTPPPRTMSAYPFDHTSSAWNNRISWTITSPSSSPYPSHSPLPNSEHQA